MPAPTTLRTACELCRGRRAVMRRPKTGQKLCKECFFNVFETEIHNTITDAGLFYPGERVAIGASGGKDSTVLAYVLKTLNERYNYGVHFVLLSIDEGIAGYRDDSLETVKRNKDQYNLSLEIVSYKELYDWTMDEIVGQIGKKNNCTYCGVFRRQALDRGAQRLGIRHVVTGHNADDIAETVLMNILRGDVARLEKSTAILTGSSESAVKRSKPFKYTYEKEIVLYAHYRKLDYFSTECTYSPEAFRGTARTLIKNLEAVRPSSIIDVIRSGESFVLRKSVERSRGRRKGLKERVAQQEVAQQAQEGKLPPAPQVLEVKADGSVKEFSTSACERCGYLSSNRICKACVLLEGLNAGRAQVEIEGSLPQAGAAKLGKQLEALSF